MSCPSNGISKIIHDQSAQAKYLILVGTGIFIRNITYDLSTLLTIW